MNQHRVREQFDEVKELQNRIACLLDRPDIDEYNDRFDGRTNSKWAFALSVRCMKLVRSLHYACWLFFLRKISPQVGAAWDKLKALLIFNLRHWMNFKTCVQQKYCQLHLMQTKLSTDKNIRMNNYYLNNKNLRIKYFISKSHPTFEWHI